MEKEYEIYCEGPSVHQAISKVKSVFKENRILVEPYLVIKLKGEQADVTEAKQILENINLRIVEVCE